MKVVKFVALLETMEELEKHLKREKDKDGLALISRAKKQFELALNDLKEKGDAT